MIYTKEDRPQRLQSAHLIVEEIQDELMVYDPARNKAFCLNQTAAYVWKLSDGKTSVGEMAELMAKELGKPVNEQVVWYALDILAKDGLLVQVDDHPVVSAGVTRRALLQRLGMGAAAVVPLVTVLAVAPSKAHASSSKSYDPPRPYNRGKGGNNHNWNNGNPWNWFYNIFHL